MRTQRYASVWQAIEATPQQAASLRARAELLMALQDWLKTSGITQTAAAELLCVTQPRISDLARGKIDLFSLDSLMDMAVSAGLSPRISIRRPKARRRFSGEPVTA